MTILKKDLQTLHKQIKVLEKRMDRLIATAENSEKPKAAKKAPAEKAPAKRGTAKPTATDQVLKIINRSKRGSIQPL